MKFSKVLVAAAAVMALGSAQAAPIPYTLGTDVIETIGAGGVLEFSFTLSPGLTNLDSLLLSPFGATTSFALISGATTYTPFATTSLFGGAQKTYTYTDLPGGSYIAKITGNQFTQIGFKADAVTTPVPEPESVAMALAGIGVAGTLLRRRKVS